QDRPAASDLYRRDAARLRGVRRTRLSRSTDEATQGAPYGAPCVSGRGVLSQQCAQRGARDGGSPVTCKWRMAFTFCRKQPQLDLDAVRDEAEVRHRCAALWVKLNATLAGSVRDALILEESHDGFRLVTVQVQLDGRVCVG